MNMQQMMIQAQRMKRELDKAKKALAEQEFEVAKGGAVTVVVMGDRSVKSVTIDPAAFEADNKEMIEDMIVMATNEAMEKVDAAEAEIEERITGQRGGLGF